MPSKNLLKSQKINKTINFATSESIIDWFLSTLNSLKKKKEYKNDPRIKNKSKFLNFILENFLAILNSGKTLDDFDDFLKRTDADIRDFYKDTTFKANITHYNKSILYNKYIMFDELNLGATLMEYIDFINKKELTIKRIMKFIDRFRNFMIDNKITKNIYAEIVDNKYNLIYMGRKKNIHFEYTKVLLVLLGHLGFKLINHEYYKNYVKISCQKVINTTLEERKKLAKENQKVFLNYSKMVNDKKEHMWLDFSNFNNTLITFTDYDSGKEILKENIKKLKMYSGKNFKKDVIKLFDKMGWINMKKSKNNNFFEVNISEKNNPNAYKLLYEFIDSD